MNVQDFMVGYFQGITLGMGSIRHEDIQKVIDHLGPITSRVYVAGNGGSAAIANHLCCDVSKASRHLPHSLVANPSLITMIGNDIGFEDSISWQVEKCCWPGDMLILISSSGKSPNIVKAAKVGKAKGALIVGLTGFDGGELRQIADISIHVHQNNYGIIEDCHQMVMHIISQYVRRERGL